MFISSISPIKNTISYCSINKSKQISSDNTSVSFKSNIEEICARYEKKYKNFNKVVPREVFRLIEDNQHIDLKYAQGHDDNGNPVDVTFKKEGRLFSKETYGNYHPDYPQTVYAYNTETKKLKTKYQMGITMYMHNPAPTVVKRTEYYDDGVSPKYDFREEYIKAPWRCVHIEHYSKNGVIDRKYDINIGDAYNNIIIKKYDESTGKFISKSEYNPY